jgi:hypothetical protein
MKRGSLLPLLCVIALAAATVSVPVFAQPPSEKAPAGTPSPEDKKQALEHAQRAQELYSKGSYPEAVEELQIARKLDPTGANLVRNLSTIYEKMQKWDEAIAAQRTYKDMPGLTPAEKEKAEATIKRLEGAKARAPKPDPTAPATTAPPPEPPEHGRIDAATIAAGSIGAAGLLAGGGLGVYAITQRPSNFVTGRDGTYAQLQDKTDKAHTFAIVADVCLGVGIVGAIAAGWLYFGRTKDPQSDKNDTTSAKVSVGPGSLFVSGSF